MDVDEGLPAFLRDEGYKNLRIINGSVCALCPMMFTTGLMVGLNRAGYKYRYCFEDLLYAQVAIREFDGQNDPQGFLVRKGLGDDYRPNDPYNTGLPLPDMLSRESDDVEHD